MGAVYRFLGRKLHRPDRVIVRGDLFTPTESELSGFKDLLQFVHEGSPVEVPKEAPVNPDPIKVPEQPVSESEDISDKEKSQEKPININIDDLTVAQVLSAVENGKITAQEAIEKELDGKSRVSLLRLLQKLVD